MFEMNEKVFLAKYSDGSTRVLGDYSAMSDEPFVEGRWVEFDDSEVPKAEWQAWEAEEIIED